MDMRDITEWLNPEASDAANTVSRKPTSGGIFGVPAALARMVASPALAVADSGLGALRSIGTDYPNIGNLMGAVESGVMAAQGDPYYDERRALYDAERRYYGSQAGLNNAESAMLNRLGAGGPAMGEVPLGGGLTPEALEYYEMLIPQLAMAGRTAEASALQTAVNSSRKELQERAQRDLYGRNYTPQALDERRREIKREFAPYQDVNLVRNKTNNTPASGTGIPILVNILQQQIDPGAVVRGEDVRIITKGVLSGADMTVRELGQWFDENAGADIVAPKLKEAILKILDAKEDDFADKFEQAERRLKSEGMTAGGVSRALPFVEAGRAAVKARNARREAAGLNAKPDPVKRERTNLPFPASYKPDTVEFFESKEGNFARAKDANGNSMVIRLED